MTDTSPERMAAILKSYGRWHPFENVEAIEDLLAKVAELEAGRKADGAIFCEIMATAIAANSDAAIIKHATYDGRYALAAVRKVADRIAELEAQKKELIEQRDATDREHARILERYQKLEAKADRFAARIDDLEAQQDGANSRIETLLERLTAKAKDAPK